jgi:hypothetical protein
MSTLDAIYDVAIFPLENYGLPKQNNYVITKLSHLLLILKNKEDANSVQSIDDLEYSTDSEYEERTGIKRKYVPKNKPEPISSKIIEMFQEIPQEKKDKLLCIILSNLEKGQFSWTYFLDCENDKLLGLTANENKMNMIGITKDIKYKALNYYFRKQTYITKQNKEPYHAFYTSINAYNVTFTPSNILKEYYDLILDDELKTESLDVFNINKTRNEWIKLLKEHNKIDNSEAYYNYLC